MHIKVQVVKSKSNNEVAGDNTYIQVDNELTMICIAGPVIIEFY